jgi:hypothetical protein
MESKATYGMAQTEGVVVEVATKHPRTYKRAPLTDALLLLLSRNGIVLSNTIA